MTSLIYIGADTVDDDEDALAAAATDDADVDYDSAAAGAASLGLNDPLAGANHHSLMAKSSS